MHTAIRIFLLMSIVSLFLGSLTGCGEKRIHVSTASGDAGEEAAVLSSIDESAPTETLGLSKASLDESALSVQGAAGDELFPEVETPAMTNEPIHMAHAPEALSSQDGSSDSSLSDALAFTQKSVSPMHDPHVSAQESGLHGNDGPSSSLGEGQDFAAQSSSSPKDHGNHSLASNEDFREPTSTQMPDLIDSSSQNISTELHEELSMEGLEPVTDLLQIAKAEPSDSRQDQLNRIQKEKFDKAANLEDVFFQFDSWTLTQEGKQSLQRTLGWFEQDPSSNLIVEGHADQRGTQAYNMVLAKKRAGAVQNYLSQLGIESSRMAVISYGKDKPFCQDMTEVCHQLNRRGHLLIPNR